jgi:hypothetical protein
MPTYRVLRKSDNKTVYAYTADAPVAFPELPFAEFDHIAEVNVNQDGSINELPGTRITRLAFRSRFSTAEKVGLEIASLDNPAATMEQRSLAATLRAYLQDVQAATFIDLHRPDTRAGVQQLEQLGLLGAGRAAQILDTPPTAEERYTG